MIRPLLTIICAGIVALSPPAFAAKKQGNVTESDIKAAEGYAAWAKMFGQGELASIAVDEERARLMMEFVGDGETLENWTKMVTVNVFGLPATAAEQQKMMLGYIGGFRSYVLGLKESGMAVDLKGFAGFSKTPKDTPDDQAPPPQHALYQFAVGKDKADEDNAGIIFPLEGRLVNFQVQRRQGKTVSTEEVAMLNNFLMSNMNADAAAEEKTAPAKQPAKEQDTDKKEKKKEE